MKRMLSATPEGTRVESAIAIAIIADMREESWPSMDLVAERLAGELESRIEKGESSARAEVKCERSESGSDTEITAELIRPAMRRRFSRRNAGRACVADRLSNRFFDYPRLLRGRREEFDLFHIVDHSYSQLVHALPAARTVVTCHDVDTFRCLWAPGHGGRGIAFRIMTNRILSGMRKAAYTCCDSVATREELVERGLVAREKTCVVPLGVHPAFTRTIDQHAAGEVDALLRGMGAAEKENTVDLLHVGSTIQRKRIDVLLEVIARLHSRDRRVRLLRVGGDLRPEQQAKATALGIANRIITFPFLSPEQLAAVYHRALLVFLPSDAEGFGLPALEAIACGTPVLVSELPVLREVGGSAAEYAPVADVNAWIAKADELLAEHRNRPDLWELRRERGRSQASNFTWAETARRMMQVYGLVLSESRGHHIK